MREGHQLVERPIATPNASDPTGSRERIGQTRVEEGLSLRSGAIGVIVGSLGVFAFRLAHGDAPAANPEAHLRFVAAHPAYAGVHLATILAVLVWTGGIIALAGTLSPPMTQLLGRWGTACVLIGAAIFSIDVTIDGVAGQDLATAWAAATPAAHADLVRAAHTALTMLRGPSLVAIVLLWGLPLLLFGSAVLLEGYPAWLGWSGLAVGAVTILAALMLWYCGRTSSPAWWSTACWRPSSCHCGASGLVSGCGDGPVPVAAASDVLDSRCEQANLARWRGVRTALFAVETDGGAFCNRRYAKTREEALAGWLV